ncbi:ABC transporter ATP-binding protein [Ureibacillus sp. Re31]|uniref:ABC transporter ATP-binding protein n=1 Tax=Ureibacillus galli TaxID=2762222 RepID=A0ABR8X854_9BACL|nr:ABC transporter ATP-binding protein [Ureibacillus galli]MBD8025378.1 ABC transporter ATP-binding protein [Ureibacillus galli]
MSILTIKNLSKSYKKQKILDDISLTIDSPGIWALVGPNGVGKTTFLNVLTNILPADSGSVELVGKPNRDFRIFREVSYLQDNTVLFEYLTGYDHLKYVCDVNKINKARIKEVADYVGMTNYLKKVVGNYSLGMKQHLLLAMAIINKPKLLFLDEPLNGLDPSSAILMRKILIELAENGTTIILSSHNLSEIDRVTKQILFLKDKKIIQINTANYETVYYYLALSHSEKGKLILSENGFLVNEESGKLKIQLKDRSLSNVISILQNHQINIYDIEKEITGSEKLYEELFEL